MNKKQSFSMRRVLAGSLGVLTALALAFGPMSTAFAASTDKLDSLKSQASQLNEQGSSLKNQLSGLQNEADSKLEEKAVLEQQISVLSAQIVNTQALIEEYDVQIADKQVELENAQQKADEYYQLFLARFRDLEEQGSVSYWSILFDAASFSDLLDRISFIADVVHYDNQIVDQLQAARQAVADAKADLETNQAEQVQAKTDLESQQAELSTDEAAVDAAIAEINSKADVYQSQLDEIKSQADALDDQIAAAQKEYEAQVAAEKAAAEKAAAEKAAAEKAAAEKAAQEAANKNNNSSSNSNSSSSSSGSGRISMVWPCASTRVTSGFGKRNSPTAGASTYHKGIDIGASTGTAIYAAASGTVTEAGYSSSRGNYVVIYHSNGVSTAYMHCSALYVSSGDKVSQGQTIAAVGSTGISTGSHLHFSVIEDGTYVNPRNYV